ncbi:MAG: hypothetical protein P1V18_03045 [Candidatus Gracilibacteria bacterium]|nr:hypothetical protein [Candidatus Gracilibacteria bacterium]
MNLSELHISSELASRVKNRSAQTRTLTDKQADSMRGDVLATRARTALVLANTTPPQDKGDEYGVIAAAA